MAPADRRIHHLTTRTEWEAARVAGSYESPSLADEEFIHFSNPPQVERTARKFYADVPDLVILTVAVERLPATTALRDEPGDPGREETFPHLYGRLPVDAVVDVQPFVLDDWTS
jgi:uncharacterized protein (DUF952 family)